MTHRRNPQAPTRWLWIGAAVFVLGRLIDLGWHATHPEFETATDQLQAHAVVWLGALLMISAAARGIGLQIGRAGYFLVVAAGLGYAAVAIWHFYEHSQLRDPELPHLLLLITNVLMLIGAAWVWFASRGAKIGG